MLAFSLLNRIEAKLEHWYVTGLRQQDIVPSLVASIGDASSSLLKIEFETNPENSPADQTLLIQSQPVEVIYDAVSIGRKWLWKLSQGLGRWLHICTWYANMRPLSLNPQLEHSHGHTCACNPELWEVGRRISGTCWLQPNSTFSEKPCLKGRRQRMTEQDSTFFDLCTHAWVYSPARTHDYVLHIHTPYTHTNNF